MTSQVPHREHVSGNNLYLQKSSQSRSWKRRKKCQNAAAEVKKNRNVDIKMCDIPRQSNALITMSSTTTHGQPHHKHNYRLSNSSSICEFKQENKNVNLTFFHSFVIQLSISMIISNLLAYLNEKEYCENKKEKMDNKRNFIDTLKLNPMRSCSLSIWILSAVFIISSFGPACYGLKNEFRK